MFVAFVAALVTAQVDVVPPTETLPRAPEEDTSTSSSSRYETVTLGRRPSPSFTQDRNFTSTRVWLLDPGAFEVELWSRTRTFSKSSVTGQTPDTEHLWQAEIEIGAYPHLQIDLYQNFNYNIDTDGVRRVTPEGTQIEARIAIPDYWGQMFLNPVIYLEWHPQYGGPERAEIRFLLAEDLSERVLLAVNPYFETNVTKTDTPVISTQNGMPTAALNSQFIADAEFGATVAAAIRVADGFNLSAQAKIGADMLGTNTPHFVAWVGPGLFLKPLPEPYSKYLKLMATVLYGVAGTDNTDGTQGQQIEAQFIVGSQF
jgi:hypothetical protein